MAAIDVMTLSDSEHSVQLRRAVIAATIGTAIEWYDFFLNASAAALVFGPLFFPASNPTVSTLAALSVYALAPSENRGRVIPLVPGALSNLEHVKFGLRGCLAAGLCYVTYNVLFWPGISTAITTCLLTALTTIGASRQKQVLRFA